MVRGLRRRRGPTTEDLERIAALAVRRRGWEGLARFLTALELERNNDEFKRRQFEEPTARVAESIGTSDGDLARLAAAGDAANATVGMEERILAFGDAYNEVDLDLENEFEAAVAQLLNANLNAVRSDPTFPLGLALFGLAAPWAAGAPPDETAAAPVGVRSYLADRKELYDDLDEQFEGYFAVAMTVLQREPTMFSRRELIVLAHALNDGLAMRWLLDPDAFDWTRAGDALWQLLRTFTVPIEAGAASQVRERAISAMERLSSTGAVPPDSWLAVAEAMIPPEDEPAVRAAFTSFDDLREAAAAAILRQVVAAMREASDAVKRDPLLSSEPIGPEARHVRTDRKGHHLQVVWGVLRTLAVLSDRHLTNLALTRRHPSEDRIVESLTVALSTLGVRDAPRLAGSAVRYAFGGTHHVQLAVDELRNALEELSQRNVHATTAAKPAATPPETTAGSDVTGRELEPPAQ